MKNVSIILAGGIGNRFDSHTPKQFAKLAGKYVIEHTIDAFEKHQLINEIYIVVHKNFYGTIEDILQRNAYTKVKKILIGGPTRQESSRIGVISCDDDIRFVLIHDAARPFVSDDTITNIIEALNRYCAVDTAIPSADTIIEVSDKRIITNIPARKFLLRGQTPQGFWLDTIKKAHSLAEKEKISDASDDCSLILKFNLGRIFVVRDSEFNMKITYPIDIHIADKIFQINKTKLSNIDFDLLRKQLKDKVIIVFGGTSGIGQEISNLGKLFEMHVYSMSRKTNHDICNIECVKEALEGVYKIHNRIDYVICTSGILKMGYIETTDASDILDQININLLGNIFVGKASISYLKETKGSLIFFASSSYSRGRKGFTAYSASKAALVNFVQGFSEEVSHHGIRINVINPERTDTPLRWKNFGNEDKATLLSPRFVALVTLKTIVSNITGAIVEVKKMDEIEYTDKLVNLTDLYSSIGVNDCQ